MRRINYNSIDTGCHKSVYPLHAVASHTHSGCHTQTSELVLACIRLILRFSYILISYKAYKMAFSVYDRKLLYFISLKYIGCFFKICRLRSCHKVLRSHHLVNRTVKITFKSQITVCDNTHKFPVSIHNRNTANVILLHHGKCIAHLAALAYGHGIIDHTVFRTLHSMDLTGLLLYRHVFVNNSYTSLSRYGYSKLSLSHGVHRSRDQRHIESYIT